MRRGGSVKLEELLLSIVRERLSEGDTASEVAPHLEGAVFDEVLPAIGAGLEARVLLEAALGLVDWSRVAERLIWQLEGSDPWADVEEDRRLSENENRAWRRALRRMNR